MPDIRNWRNSPPANALVGEINWSEGMPPSLVNDSARAMMADLRGQFEDDGWFTRGDAATYLSATSLSLAGNLSAVYHPGRRLRAIGPLTGRVHGTIASASVSNNVTVVTITWDAGGLQNEALSIAIGQIAYDGQPAPGVRGPAASVDRGLARFDGLGGNRLLGTSVVVDAANNMFVPGLLSLSGALVMNSRPIDEAKAPDITAAATTNLGTLNGNFAVVQGSTAISSFGSAQGGARRILRFNNAVTLTHSANLLLPGGQNILAQPGDMAVFVALGSSAWACVAYQRVSGLPVQVNRIYVETRAFLSGGSVIPFDDSVPQVSEGSEIIAVTITPRAASSRLLIRASGPVSAAAASVATVALFRDGAASARVARSFNIAGANQVIQHGLEFEEAASAAIATTYSLRFGLASVGSWYVNGNAGSRHLGGASAWSMSVEEIPA